MITRCASLCELDVAALCRAVIPSDASTPSSSALEAVVQRIGEEATWSCCDRLYLGSSFCVNAFLRGTERSVMQAVQTFAESHGISCTLTVPTPSEGELPIVKRRLALLLEAFSCFDEVTVNDYGMLDWLADRGDVALNVGRLFSKDLRDLRYEAGFPSAYRPAFLGAGLDALQEAYPTIRGIEFDPCGRAIDLTEAPLIVTPAVHAPYLFVTTGSFCPYAPVTDKGIPARAGSPCSHQCDEALTTYRLEGEAGAAANDAQAAADVFYTKHGKTVYMMNEGVPVRSRVAYRVVRAPRHFGWLLDAEAQR
ncbi:hypothetical protein [uncultured Adlercreutzia sp.]|uniref:hypothetical protein n=1 Tax=uncultured Adlercreutzia sp. TaxID=875803 RepID=UPI0025EF3EE5|nr:hypothetical protein [uncultured Adlercreutzia sp.]MCI9261571.1 hypothetical protein [Eggerthellaceae bacterium]